MRRRRETRLPLNHEHCPAGVRERGRGSVGERARERGGRRARERGRERARELGRERARERVGRRARERGKEGVGAWERGRGSVGERARELGREGVGAWARPFRVHRSRCAQARRKIQSPRGRLWLWAGKRVNRRVRPLVNSSLHVHGRLRGEGGRFPALFLSANESPEEVGGQPVRTALERGETAFFALNPESPYTPGPSPSGCFLFFSLRGEGPSGSILQF
jgi:hypothetical protein